MNANFENQKKLKNKCFIDRAKLRKMAKMTDYDCNWFKSLAKCVDRVVEICGHVSIIRQFWDLVSFQMKNSGYEDSDAFTTRNKFTEYINDYYSLVIDFCLIFFLILIIQTILLNIILLIIFLFIFY